jgi:phosphatidate cytidylyltransferase
VVLFPVAVAAVLLASGEILILERAAGLQPPAWVVYAGNLLLLLAGWVPAVWWQQASGAVEAGSVLGAEALSVGRQGALLALAAGVILAFVGEMWRYRHPGDVTRNLAGTTLGLFYVGVLLVFVAHLRLAFGIGALASLVIVVKMCDTGAYTVGRLVGRHKMAPVLSPGKTWEGAAGGLAFACLGAWATFRWLVPVLEPQGTAPGAWWGWILFGLVVGGAGMLGDLAESLLKRDAGRKDSSDWLPGFGGVLDILDSILLAAPVAYGCWWALSLFGG